jgi:ribonuclease BN (tRNA processing enzyme)
MDTVRLTFLGCGDAFGSGGRLHTCFHLDGGGEPLLIDCGATSLQALKRFGVDPASLGAVALSHLHGDHFGGLPWLMLDGRFAHRSKPLVVSGPAGTERRVQAAFDALYPGALSAGMPFQVTYLEYAERQPVSLGDAFVTPFEVVHQSGAPSYGLRVQYGGRVVAYSGDTEWTDSLIDLARGADVFVCESNFYEDQVPGHLSFQTVQDRRRLFDCRRLVLTHMGQDMLRHLDELEVEVAHDGRAIELP